MSKVKLKVKLLSRVRLFETPWTIAKQVPLSMGFSRQEHWRGLPFPSLGDLPNPEIEPRSPWVLMSKPKLNHTVHAWPSVQFSRSVVSESLRPHELQHARPPCPSQTPGVHSNSCPSSRCRCMGLFLGFLSCSSGLYFCFCASTILSWWL